VKVDL